MLHPPFFSVFLRSFFLQAHWNYPRMQGTGFLFAMLPVARRFFADKEQRIEFLRRHSGFFNAQPYCASLALGLALWRESDLIEQRNAAAETQQEIVRAKESLCGPLGLLGDQLFWQLLKPSASALALAAALALGGMGKDATLVGAGVLLIAFNPLHFWMRWWGLKTGFRAGDELSAYLARGVLPGLRRRLAALGPYLALALTIVGFTFARREFGNSGWVAFVLGFVIVIALLKWRVALHFSLLGVALACLFPILFGLK